MSSVGQIANLGRLRSFSCLTKVTLLHEEISFTKVNDGVPVHPKQYSAAISGHVDTFLHRARTTLIKQSRRMHIDNLLLLWTI